MQLVPLGIKKIKIIKMPMFLAKALGKMTYLILLMNYYYAYQ
jgi:hypothetical protein